MRFLFLFLTVVACNASKDFSGDEVLQTINNSTLNFTNSVSISVWLYKFHYHTTEGIVCKGRTDFSQPALYLFYFDSGFLNFTYANPDGTYITWTSVATQDSTNQQLHLAVTYNYSIPDSMRVYVNAVSVAGVWSPGAGDKVGLVNANNLTTAILNTANNGLHGRFSDLAIWNAYLTDRQIASLYGGTKRTPLQFAQGLVLYYPFDEGKDNDPNTGLEFTLDYSPTHRNNTSGGGFLPADAFCGYPPNE